MNTLGCRRTLRDPGSEFITNDFRRKPEFYESEKSMIRMQSVNDNAFMESVFNRFKVEAIKLQAITSERDSPRIASHYICDCNRKRIHMSI